MGIHYAIVEGDPLDNGNGGRVIGGADHCTITDGQGRVRRQTHAGHLAWCGVCKSHGPIREAAPITRSLRGYDVRLGAYEAVDGDIVICKCPRPPRVVAVYARTVMYIDDSGHAPVPTYAATSQETPRRAYDEQFTLCDAAGKPMSETFYTVCLSSGEMVHGVTDSSGRTERHATSGAQGIRLYLGHRETAE